jgi:hypothetical protein
MTTVKPSDDHRQLLYRADIRIAVSVLQIS